MDYLKFGEKNQVYHEHVFAFIFPSSPSSFEIKSDTIFLCDFGIFLCLASDRVFKKIKISRDDFHAFC
jgi:hypothetical protein|uniref:Uncharacterized protein n=1 Tax=viral metagenome TaxID=1070528 RepID=A0A6C0BKD4_9ZZZZ